MVGVYLEWLRITNTVGSCRVYLSPKRKIEGFESGGGRVGFAEASREIEQKRAGSTPATQAAAEAVATAEAVVAAAASALHFEAPPKLGAPPPQAFPDAAGTRARERTIGTVYRVNGELKEWMHAHTPSGGRWCQRRVRL